MHTAKQPNLILHQLSSYIYTMYMQEPSGRCLKTVVISVKDKEINSGPWKNISVDAQAPLLHPLPLPLRGLVTIGYQTIAYYNKDIQHAIDPPIIKVRAQTAVVVPGLHLGFFSSGGGGNSCLGIPGWRRTLYAEATL